MEATTVSRGTAAGPEAILKASRQVDLFDLDVLKPYEAGIFWQPVSPQIAALAARARTLALPVVEAGGALTPALQEVAGSVNAASRELNTWVYEQTKGILSAGKIAAVVGGDHSCPYGAFKAASEHFPSFGLLHFDAHSDTRKAYEGFEFSHASIIHNAMESFKNISHLVQIGIRDVCEDEMNYLHSLGTRARAYTDRDLARRKLDGVAFSSIVEEMITMLPQDVWVTFDIDAFDPKLCPNTELRYPAGLNFKG